MARALEFQVGQDHTFRRLGRHAIAVFTNRKATEDEIGLGAASIQSFVGTNGRNTNRDIALVHGFVEKLGAASGFIIKAFGGAP